jgi:hypothetical protein
MSSLPRRLPWGPLPEAQHESAPTWADEELKRQARFKSVTLPVRSISSSLKQKIRRGVPHALRLPVWFASITGASIADHDCASDFLSSRLTQTLPELLAAFGVRGGSVFTPADPALLQLVLNAFAESHPSVTTAPLLPLAASLLLHRADPPLALFLLNAMVDRESFYFTVDEVGLLVSFHVMEGFICRKCQRLMAWVDQMPFKLADIFALVMPNFFMPTVDHKAALSIFDVFLSEGRKVLSRLSARLLFLLEPRLTECRSWEGVEALVLDFLRELSSPAALADFLESAFKISAPSGSSEQKARLSYQPIQRQSSGESASVRTLPAPRTRPAIRRFSESEVADGRLLTPARLLEVRRALPLHMDRCGRAVRRYRMSVDGTALSTLIGRCSQDSFWILLFATEERVFGAAFSGSLAMAFARKGKFIEQATAVVFTTNGEEVAVFKKAGVANTSMYSADGNGIAFGAPKPALYLRADFRTIASAPCETFASPAFVVNGHVGDRLLEIELFQLMAGGEIE